MESLLTVRLLFGLPLMASAGKPCSSDWAYRNGSCWSLGAKALAPFEADRACRTDGARSSPEELDIAREIAAFGGAEVWLGGAEVWPRWSDGSPWNASLPIEPERGRQSAHQPQPPSSRPQTRRTSVEMNPAYPCWALYGGYILWDIPLHYFGNGIVVVCESGTVEGACARADSTAAFGRCFRVAQRRSASCLPEAVADACRQEDAASWPVTFRSLEEMEWVGSDWAAVPAGRNVMGGANIRSDTPEADLLRWLDGSVLDFRPPFKADYWRRSGRNLVSLRPSDGLLVARNPNSALLRALCRKKLSGDSAYYRRVAADTALDTAAVRCAERCLAAGGCDAFATEPCVTGAPPSTGFVSKASPPALVQHPASCAEVKARKASATSGVHLLRLPSDPPYECEEGDVHCEFEAACDFGVGGGDWTLLQRQESGGEDFNRTMHEYELGFGAKEGDHWLGLWKLQSLAAYRPSELLIRARFVGDNCTQWALYENFRLLSYEGYPFHYDSLNPASSLPDALASLKGTGRFGVDSRNGSGGWWWDGVEYGAHPNGRLRSAYPASSSLWASWGDFGGLVSVSLALRHSDFAPELSPDEEWCSSKKLSTTTATTTTTLSRA